jgi:hypothetical protein
LSCLKGNFHEQFLGEGVPETAPPYPTCDTKLRMNLL